MSAVGDLLDELTAEIERLRAQLRTAYLASHILATMEIEHGWSARELAEMRAMAAAWAVEKLSDLAREGERKPVRLSDLARDGGRKP